MNRFQSSRPHYFIPKGLQNQKPKSQGIGFAAPASNPQSSTFSTSSPSPASSASSTHRMVDPAPSTTQPRPSAPTPRSSTSSTPSASSSFPASSACAYRTSDNRRCRMLRAKDHPELCSHHAALELRALEKSVAIPLAREILGTLTDLRSGAAVNQAMGNLMILSADGRITERRAASLTYLGQVLLQTLAAIKSDEWRKDAPPSAKQALTAKLIPTLPPSEPGAAPVAQGD